MKKNQFIYAFLLISSFFLNSQNSNKKDVHYFIQKGLEYHSSIKQAKFEINKYKNLQLEAISVFTPKINGITWLAPMYTINKTDDIYQTQPDFNTWGPYYHLNLEFQQPVFAFTRVISGIKAAQQGRKVAETDVEIARWAVAKEIRTYYYGVIFAKTMMKTVELADSILTNALKEAKKSIEEGKTDVTEVDLDKLNYFYSQIPINKSFIEKSIEQAQMALFLSTGEKLNDSDIPDIFDIEIADLKDFEYYKGIMFAERPLFKKLNFGINATRHLMDLEYKSMLPILFLGGYIKYNAAPTVYLHHNSFMSNNYNTSSATGRGVDGGFAAGLFWQFDPLKSVARGLQKKADLDKLLELKNYATEGFPVQLYKTLSDLNDLKVKIYHLKDAIQNAQSWMFFAANAYAIGGGEAKDIMEGLAAYVKSKTDYYMAIYDYNKLLGELCEIVGIDVTLK
ncbi:MAG: TolC family protein [Spirochaetes bacterium]|nr:TolC family protein [Spirochaetota bacterium]